MQERIAKIIEMLELVEVRRSQNHKLLATAVDSLRAIREELATQVEEEGMNHE